MGLDSCLGIIGIIYLFVHIISLAFKQKQKHILHALFLHRKKVLGRHTFFLTQHLEQKSSDMEFSALL